MYKKNYRRGNRKNQIKTVEQADKWISSLEERIALYKNRHSANDKARLALDAIFEPLKAQESSIRKQEVTFLLFFDWWPSKAKAEFSLYKNKLSQAVPKVLAILKEYEDSVGLRRRQDYYFEYKISKLHINEPFWFIFDELVRDMQFPQHLLNSIQYNTEKLDIAYKTRERIIGEEDKLKRKKETENRKKALLAQATGTTRDLGTTIKKQLPSDHLCPYCDQPLGNDYHADHIYPVSKGGQSRPENMVNVCARCNMEKSNLTLVKFIQLKGLNRERIEGNLQLLGKEF